MADKELAAMLRSIIKEELKPVNKELVSLKKGQSEIKKQLKYIWDDIQKLDNRLTTQEKLRKVK